MGIWGNGVQVGTAQRMKTTKNIKNGAGVHIIEVRKLDQSDILLVKSKLIVNHVQLSFVATIWFYAPDSGRRRHVLTPPRHCISLRRPQFGLVLKLESL